MAIIACIPATHDVGGGDTDSALSSTELRIFYRYYPGTPMTMYARNGDPGHPGDPDEIEFLYAEQEIVDTGTAVWVRLADDHDLARWAEAYLEDHEDAARERVAEDDPGEDPRDGDDPDDSEQRAQDAREQANGYD